MHDGLLAVCCSSCLTISVPEELGKCSTCGAPMRTDRAGWTIKKVRGMSQFRIAMCENGHGWGRYDDEPEAWFEVPDWSARRLYQWASPAKLRHDLLAVVEEINVRPVHRSDKFDDIVKWVLNDLPTVAPDHPRTPDALAMATVWWKYRSPNA